MQDISEKFNECIASLRARLQTKRSFHEARPQKGLSTDREPEKRPLRRGRPQKWPLRRARPQKRPLRRATPQKGLSAEQGPRKACPLTKTPESLSGNQDPKTAPPIAGQRLSCTDCCQGAPQRAAFSASGYLTSPCGTSLSPTARRYPNDTSLSQRHVVVPYGTSLSPTACRWPLRRVVVHYSTCPKYTVTGVHMGKVPAPLSNDAQE